MLGRWAGTPTLRRAEGVWLWPATGQGRAGRKIQAYPTQYTKWWQLAGISLVFAVSLRESTEIAPSNTLMRAPG